MPEKISEDFMSLLERYDFTEKSVLKSELIVTANSTIRLDGMNLKQSYISPITLRTVDLNLVKKWIGVDDNLIEKAKNSLEIIKDDYQRFDFFISNCNHFLQLKEKDPKSLEYNRKIFLEKNYSYFQDFLSSYIFRYSKPLQLMAETVLQLVDFSVSVSVWPISFIEVQSNAKLEIGEGFNSLVAQRIIIHQGGQIKANCRGQLNIQCDLLKILN